MKVVADTSPLHYLILIDEVSVLPALFDRVIIPFEVRGELLHPHAPGPVRSCVAGHLAWLEVVPVESLPNRRVPDLDLGEAAAILLAEEQRTPTVLLMDDAKGRREAAIRKNTEYRNSGNLAIGVDQGLCAP